MNWNFGSNGFGDGPFGGGIDVDTSIDQSTSVASINHTQLGIGRVIWQYQNSPKLLGFLAVCLGIADQIEAALISLLQLPNIDLMGGVNLDTIGIIVGQSRTLVDAIELVYFGFADTPSALTFGELGKPSVGSRFYEQGENFLESTTLQDPEYRILIRARIAKNYSNGTPNSILSSLGYIFNTAAVNIQNPAPMHLTLSIGAQLTAIQKIIVTTLDLLPRPAAVIIDAIVFYNPGNFFGFEDTPGAYGFSDLNDTDIVGGVFAEQLGPI